MNLTLDSTSIDMLDGDVAERFGRKAVGLLSIPPAWRPPALFVSCELYQGYLHAKGDFSQLCVTVWAALQGFATDVAEMLIRSSATDETLNERGQYKSLKIGSNASPEAFQAVVEQIFAHYQETGASQMCLIVQQFYSAQETGYLSNELRLVDKPYRWIVERHLLASPNLTPLVPISAKQAVAPSSAEPLVCLSQQELRSRLRSVAHYFWRAAPSQRVLLEWCWDGRKLWIVQKDNANPGPLGKSPNSFSIAPFSPPSLEQGYTFQRYQTGSTTPWSKLRNVAEFATGGRMPPHRLFYATARVVASVLAADAGALAEEIDALTSAHAVIRTDTLEKQFNLNRTHTVDGRQAVDWLRTQLALWDAKGVSADDVAFILHSYIPARAAAWSYYKKGTAVVRIDALWGLADGMQYYPTDTVLCSADTGTRVSETIRFKELVLLEQDTGAWVTDRILPRFARHRVLTASERRDIALRTREIAANLNSDVQIMWFVDVPKDFDLEHNLPWFKPPPEQDIDERRSNVISSVKVRALADLERVRALEPGSAKIILEPSGEDLRSEDFISGVCKVAVALNLPVEIRGSPLSHAFHQLRRGGAQVFSAEPGKTPLEMRQRKAFHKLVRDEIPNSIRAKGEAVASEELPDAELIPAIIGKIFEEAEEYLAAEAYDQKLEELADIFELVSALAAATHMDLADVVQKAEQKRRRRGGFEKGVILRSTSTVDDRLERPPTLFGDAPKFGSLVTPNEPSGKRSEISVTTLLVAGPTTARLDLSNGQRVKVRIALSGGILSLSGGELVDNENQEQQRLL